MPELVECKIMSDFINKNCKDKTFNKVFTVEKGNIPKLNINENFTLNSTSSGKEIILNIQLKDRIVPIYVFMGMSGNWNFVDTEVWQNRKFTRLRLDTIDGKSLLLYGLYMGPKYKIGSKFTGTKRGPDPTLDFESFKSNILSNLEKKDFNQPIYDVLLNQKYFSGIGNYLRSTILYYMNVSPFEVARDYIIKNPSILDLCKEIPNKAYKLNGGQLQDWKNPFDVDSKEFKEWVFYQKGNSIKDTNGRTFWYDTKWSVTP